MGRARTRFSASRSLGNPVSRHSAEHFHFPNHGTPFGSDPAPNITRIAIGSHSKMPETRSEAPLVWIDCEVSERL